jgi:AbrB family looped-hinge helix DNA binding protein
MNETDPQPENSAMALVKLLRGGQLTLPAEARKALRLAEGDYLEAEVVQGGVMLKPVAVVDRGKAWDDLMAIIDEPKWRGPGPEPSDDELLELADEEVHALRREHE